MKTPNLSNLPAEDQDRIDAYLDGTIEPMEFKVLQDRMMNDPALRAVMRRCLALDDSLRNHAETVGETSSAAATRPWLELTESPGEKPAGRSGKVMRFPSFVPLAMAASVVFFLALGALYWSFKRGQQSEGSLVRADHQEPVAQGFAVLVGQANTVWENTSSLADGALLPSGPLHLASGVAQIELFSGVTVIVEGEAEFEIVSPMEMTVARGKVRARVPEPAHGFRIHTTEGEVVDLGTEFALNVSAKQSEVHVIEGEVEWHPRTEAMQRMSKGEALSWNADGKSTSLAANASSFVGTAEFGEKLALSRKARHEVWLRYSEKLRHDPRLVAYYQMGAADSWNRRLPNEAAASADTVREGAIVAAARVADRWGVPGGALDFSPAGSRVRVNVPGEFQSLTLMTWVRINSLDRWYNSLFLTDGAKLNQPHWQIMDDGRLFFSVKKREGWDPRKRLKDKHHFFSPTFWNASLSGQWLMIATTYDVAARKVTHFLNGKVLSEEAIPDEYLVEKVTIDAASLCNWSEPTYRTDAHFAVRNLNGSMDEFALFAAALTPKEIADIYEHGKP